MIDNSKEVITFAPEQAIEEFIPHFFDLFFKVSGDYLLVG